MFRFDTVYNDIRRFAGISGVKHRFKYKTTEGESGQEAPKSVVKPGRAARNGRNRAEQSEHLHRPISAGHASGRPQPLRV